MYTFIFNQEIPRSLLRGYLAKGRGGRNRGVSPTMPFRLIPRSLLRGGFIQEIPRSLLRGYLAKGSGWRNRGVSPTLPLRLIPRSWLRGGFIPATRNTIRSISQSP